MFILIISLVALALLAALAGIIHNRSLKHRVESGELESMPDVVTPDSECCGQHEVCEKESLLAAVSKRVEYYDDEELDAYQDMPSDAYTPEQVEEFRDVMYTMQSDEVAGWVRSLQLRHVELPDELKDEVFLIVGERRTAGHES